MAGTTSPSPHYWSFLMQSGPSYVPGSAVVLPLATALALTACGDGELDLDLPVPTAVEVPAPPGSAQPFVAAHGNRLILSWTERAERGHALRFAEHDGSGWGDVRTVAAGTDWFVNWADFPSVVALDERRYFAHWLQRSGPGRYSYDVVVTTSADGGVNWTPPIRPHTDGTETEHGFVSLFAHDGEAAAVWLDGRRFADTGAGPASNEMQLRFATLRHDAGQTVSGLEVLLDDRICDCCQTAVAITGNGPVVFYRDRLAGEIRDISVTRYQDGQWSQPQPVHEDGWEINACPVNGPAADAAGSDVVVAWFTGAQQTPRVRLGFSSDAGATFHSVVPVDDGEPIGRVDVLLLDDGRALVVWLERVGEDAEIRGRLVSADGRTGASATLAATTSGRAGGFPRMARRGNEVLLAWTETGEASLIRAVRLDFGR
jgi:hypothetical protein